MRDTELFTSYADERKGKLLWKGAEVVRQKNRTVKEMGRQRTGLCVLKSKEEA